MPQNSLGIRELLYTQQALNNGISGSKRAYCFYFTEIIQPLLPSSSSSTIVHEIVYSPFKTKMVACYDRDSTSGGEGAGPQPAHAGSGLRFQDGDSLCN